MPEIGQVSVNGCQLWLQREGSGPPLLYLHGARGASWPPALRSLAKRFDVLAPELPGFGRSDTPPWWDNIHDTAYAVLDLLGTQQLRGVHLVGSSLGGWVAAEVALRSCERLASLTLVNPIGLHVKGLSMLDPFLATPEEEVRACFHNQRFAEMALALPVDAAESDRQLKNRFAFARLAWAPRLHNPHLEKWLHRLRLPTLVLCGAEDRYIPPAIGARYAERIPGARLQLLPACGHLPEMEQPEAMAAAIAGFIAELTP